MRTCLFITSFILNIYQIRYTRFFSTDNNYCLYASCIVPYCLMEFFKLYISEVETQFGIKPMMPLSILKNFSLTGKVEVFLFVSDDSNIDI